MIIFCNQHWDHFFSDSRVQISSLSLSSICDSTFLILRPWLSFESPHHLCHVLISLKFTVIAMPSLMQILRSCPNLHTVCAPWVTINGHEPETCPVWAGRALQVLRLGLSPRKYYNQAAQPSFESASRIAPSFMMQLGRQEHLRELQLQLGYNYSCASSPFLELSLDPTRGLPQLGGLLRLRDLDVSGWCIK